MHVLAHRPRRAIIHEVSPFCSSVRSRSPRAHTSSTNSLERIGGVSARAHATRSTVSNGTAPASAPRSPLGAGSDTEVEVAEYSLSNFHQPKRTWQTNQSCARVSFRGPAPRARVMEYYTHRLAVQLRRSRSNTSTLLSTITKRPSPSQSPVTPSQRLPVHALCVASSSA